MKVYGMLKPGFLGCSISQKCVYLLPFIVDVWCLKTEKYPHFNTILYRCSHVAALSDMEIHVFRNGIPFFLLPSVFL